MKDKFNLEISSRDKMLLWVLASFLIVICAYFFGYTKLVERVDSTASQLSKARSINAELRQKNANKDTYLADTVNNKNQFNTIISGYANGTSQDASLIFLRNIEKITGGWIKSTTFSTTVPIYTFGAVASSNPNAASGQAYSTDLVGYKTTLTLAYEAEYSDWKSLITYINNYYSKNTIDNISMAYNEETNVVSGTMTISTFCITGNERKFEVPGVSVESGTSNIFNSSTFVPSNINVKDTEGNYILADYDYYMNLNAATSDMGAVIIGRRDDTEGTSLLKSADNEVKQVTLRFTGSDGNYKAYYSIGNAKYPADNTGESFIPGDSLDVLILSSKRLSSDDKSGVEITVINETDMDVNIKVSDDDTSNPRVVFKQNQGIVNTYR